MTATIPDDVTTKAREKGKKQAFADEHNFGLSIREYLAAKAMAGILAAGVHTVEIATADAVRCADSLLVELAK